ncbi:hypothetical protein [Tenacibaculum holothuriorum]|nr:hypothetical protein [Tenacibaculum holothuriorum]
MKNIYYLLFIFQLVSCTSDKNEKHFLDFKLGMKKNEFTKVKYTLKKNKVINWESYDNEDAYKHIMNFEGQKIKTSLNFKFENDELSKIEINIGNWRKPNNWREKQYFMYFYSSDKSEVNKLYDLYKSKYGEPTKSEDYHNPNQIKVWEFENFLIKFNIGEQKGNSSLVENAKIEYCLSEKYLKKRKNELKEKSRTENLKKI